VREACLCGSACLDDAIVEYVGRRDHVSFVELIRAFQLSRGDLELCWMLPDRGEVVVWAGMSETTVEQLSRLVFYEKRLGPEPCSWLVYLVDGECLRLPIVTRRPPRGGYKRPHWLPLTLRTAARIRAHAR
jgi:hypothetical protein